MWQAAWKMIKSLKNEKIENSIKLLLNWFLVEKILFEAKIHHIL